MIKMNDFSKTCTVELKYIHPETQEYEKLGREWDLRSPLILLPDHKIHRVRWNDSEEQRSVKNVKERYKQINAEPNQIKAKRRLIWPLRRWLAVSWGLGKLWHWIVKWMFLSLETEEIKWCIKGLLCKRTTKETPSKIIPNH